MPSLNFLTLEYMQVTAPLHLRPSMTAISLLCVHVKRTRLQVRTCDHLGTLALLFVDILLADFVTSFCALPLCALVL